MLGGMAKPLSIQLYTVRELTKDGRHLEVLKQIAEIGYKAVEGHGYGLSPSEFRSLVEGLGMEVSSYFGGVPNPETVQEFIDTAKELGVRHTVSGFWISEFESIEAMDATAEKVNAVLPKILDSGLTFSLHNHWMEFETIDDRWKIDYLIERCPLLTLEIDLYWCTNFGVNNPVDVLRAHGKRAPLLHVKDGPMIKGEPMVAVGSGSLDYPAIFAEVDTNVTDYFIVELDECATDMMEAVAESYRYLVGNGFATGNRPA
jgi:sugar phosphate isomerase/epimerase